MGALTLAAEESEAFHRAFPGGAEPVRGGGVELSRLTRVQGHVLIPRDQTQFTVEHVHPVVAFVDVQAQLSSAAVGGFAELVSLDSAGASGQRQDHGLAADGQRAQVDARVAGGRGVDKLIERDPVGPESRACANSGATRWCTAPTATAGEVSGHKIVVLGTGSMMVHQALLFRQWSADITLFSGGQEIAAEDRLKLTAMDIPVINQAVAEVVSEGSG